MLTSFMGVLSAGGFFTGVNVQVGDSTGKVFLNSPFTIFNFSALWSYLGMLIITAIMLNVSLRDFQSGAFPLYFTKPVRKTDYLGGRFAGAFVVVLFIFSGIAAGVFLATSLPVLDSEYIGPFHLMYYLNPYLVMVIPNLFIISGFFFSISILTRKTMPVYTTAVIFLVGYLMAVNMIASMENRNLASLLEPLGLTSSMITALEYWTVAEKNSRMIPLEGMFLWNRLLWVSLTAIFTAISVWRFKFAQFLRDTSGGVSGKVQSNDESMAPPVRKHDMRTASSLTSPQSFSPGTPIRMLMHMIRQEAGMIIRSVPFLVIVLCAILFLAINTRFIGFIYGTPGYPVTYKVLQNLAGQFIIFILIIATFYAGELVWRSRDLKSHQIIDSMPVPGWVLYASHMGAISVVLLLLLPVIFLTGIGLQTFRGYFRYELGLYLIDLIVFNYPTYVLLAAVTMAVQSVVSNKYAGHFLMILYYLSTDFMEEFGFQHLLYSYARYPGKTYSDMNGYGAYVRPYLVMQTYWFVIAALLLIAGYLFWIRGVDTDFRSRLKTAGMRFVPGLRNATIVLILAATGLGGYIYYNTNILNRYYTSHEREKLQVRYEQQYKKYQTVPQPKVVATDIRVELYPENRAMETVGSYRIRNLSDEFVDTLYLTIPDNTIIVEKLELDRSFTRDIEDRELGFYSLKIEEPLKPGETARFDFAVAFKPRGFPNSDINNDFAANGTFFNNKEYYPSIGYTQDLEISNDVRRRKHGLPARPRMPAFDDPEEIKRNYVAGDGDWIEYEAVIGTSADQTAITCGHLIRDWIENDRHYFHYRMNRPMINFFPILSARYSIRQENHNGVDYAIYYHPTHEWNIDRMMDSMKKCIEYYSSSFSPFQFDQLRIVEFPRYNSFAQSFANTIPYSEAIGFVAQITEDGIDYPFGITAHETAHQWWAHQVIGANVQGTTMLSETLAQYSELMMIRREFPEKMIRKYLRYELDNYLMLRSNEGEGEPSLVLNENQGYINYHKSTMVMNLLQDLIGSDHVNHALSEFLRDFAYKGPPYPRSGDLLEYFKKATPDQFQTTLSDMFEKIIVFDNKVISAESERLSDGRFKVTIVADVRKLKVEELGVEIPQLLDDWVEFGVLDTDGEPLGIQRIRTSDDRSVVTLTVDGEPFSAGVDPLRNLIDKKPSDNVMKVKAI